MPYLDRTKRIANILLFLWGLLFLLSVIRFLYGGLFYEMIVFNYTNNIRGLIFAIVCLILSIFFLVLAIALRCLVKDAKDDLALLTERIRNMEKQDKKVDLR